jgi:hypothetical protein
VRGSKRSGRPTKLTALAKTAVHVELASRRREAVGHSCGRRGAEGVAGEVEPGHGGRIEHVEIVFLGASFLNCDRAGVGVDPKISTDDILSELVFSKSLIMRKQMSFRGREVTGKVRAYRQNKRFSGGDHTELSPHHHHHHHHEIALIPKGMVICVGDVKGSTFGTPGATFLLPLNQ